MCTTGERLRALRLKKGMSQEEVAKFIGVTRPGYVQYETNRSRPVRKLKELCNLFGVTADYILGESTEANQPMLSSNHIVNDEEWKLICKYRELSERAKIKIEARIDAEYDIAMEKKHETSKDA